MKYNKAQIFQHKLYYYRDHFRKDYLTCKINIIHEKCIEV